MLTNPRYIINVPTKRPPQSKTGWLHRWEVLAEASARDTSPGLPGDLEDEVRATDRSELYPCPMSARWSRAIRRAGA